MYHAMEKKASLANSNWLFIRMKLKHSMCLCVYQHLIQERAFLAQQLRHIQVLFAPKGN